MGKFIKMPRGGKRGHKGGRKQFSNPQALEASKLKEQKEKEWRRARGEEISDTESEEEDKKPKGAEGMIEIENPNRVQKKQHKVTTIDLDKKEIKTGGAPGGGGGGGAKPELSRREREEIDKARAKAH